MRTIRLSDEAHRIIKAKAEYLKVSKRAATEFMILNFSASTDAERVNVLALKKVAYTNFINRNTDSDLPENLNVIAMTNSRFTYWLQQAWKDGFHHGWRIFQIRKFVSFGWEVKDET